MNNDKELIEKIVKILMDYDDPTIDNRAVYKLLDLIATVRNSTIDEVRKFILDKSRHYEANDLKEWATALGLLFGDLYDLKTTSGERENEK